MSSFHMINLAANHTTVITCGSELTNRTGPRGGLLGIEVSRGHSKKICLPMSRRVGLALALRWRGPRCSGAVEAKESKT